MKSQHETRSAESNNRTTTRTRRTTTKTTTTTINTKLKNLLTTTTTRRPELYNEEKRQQEQEREATVAAKKKKRGEREDNSNKDQGLRNKYVGDNCTKINSNCESCREFALFRLRRHCASGKWRKKKNSYISNNINKDFLLCHALVLPILAFSLAFSSFITFCFSCSLIHNYFGWQILRTYSKQADKTTARRVASGQVSVQ